MSNPDHETNAEKLTELLELKDQRIAELGREEALRSAMVELMVERRMWQNIKRQMWRDFLPRLHNRGTTTANLSAQWLQAQRECGVERRDVGDGGSEEANGRR